MHVLQRYNIERFQAIHMSVGEPVATWIAASSEATPNLRILGYFPRDVLIRKNLRGKSAEKTCEEFPPLLRVIGEPRINSTSQA